MGIMTKQHKNNVIWLAKDDDDRGIKKGNKWHEMSHSTKSDHKKTICEDSKQEKIMKNNDINKIRSHHHFLHHELTHETPSTESHSLFFDWRQANNNHDETGLVMRISCRWRDQETGSRRRKDIEWQAGNKRKISTSKLRNVFSLCGKYHVSPSSSKRIISGKTSLPSLDVLLPSSWTWKNNKKNEVRDESYCHKCINGNDEREKWCGITMKEISWENKKRKANSPNKIMTTAMMILLRHFLSRIITAIDWLVVYISFLYIDYNDKWCDKKMTNDSWWRCTFKYWMVSKDFLIWLLFRFISFYAFIGCHRRSLMLALDPKILTNCSSYFLVSLFMISMQGPSNRSNAWTSRTGNQTNNVKEDDKESSKAMMMEMTIKWLVR